jgi:hypothetical protein
VRYGAGGSVRARRLYVQVPVLNTQYRRRANWFVSTEAGDLLTTGSSSDATTLAAENWSVFQCHPLEDKGELTTKLKDERRGWNLRKPKDAGR